MVSADEPKGHRPVRMCVVCRQRFYKDELLRFVCPVHGELTLTADSTGKLPGRGFYLCRDAACRNKFERFKGWQKKCKGVGNVYEIARERSCHGA